MRVCSSFILTLLWTTFAPAVFAQPVFTRILNPFSVFDDEGALYEQPFLGGFNVPRPQLIDIDADGDLDLFVQEKADRLQFYEYRENEGEMPFVWQTDAFHGLDVGQWYRFSDVDTDGDYDVLAEKPFSYIQLYRNIGTPQSPRFELAADSLRDLAGNAIFSDRQNIPNVSDIDCDGDVDLFIGKADGTVTHYERAGEDEHGVPVFEFKQDRFQNIKIVGGAAGKKAVAAGKHGANTLTFADIDRDGDEDLFWGDFFESGLLFLENQGSCENTVIVSPAAFPEDDPVLTTGYNAPTFGDINGDGGLDFILGVIGGAFAASVSSADNMLYYENNLDGTFSLRTSRLLSNIDVGNDSYPVFVDWQADGDLDLVVSNGIDPASQDASSIILYENSGTPVAPLWRERVFPEIDSTFNAAPVFGDLDDDGDLDLLAGSWRGPIAFYRNIGTDKTPRYALESEAFLPWPGGSNSTPALADLDADGDLDVVAGEAVGSLNFFRNTGTAQDPVFMLESEEFAGIDVGRRSVPRFRDLDGDGVEELIVGSDQEGVFYYRSTGGLDYEPISFFDAPPLQRGVPAFGDLDADGDLDILLGGGEGGLLYFQNQTIASTRERESLEKEAPAATLYPNPFRAQTTLTINTQYPDVVSLEIFDVLGREVGLHFEIYLAPPSSSFSVDFSGAPAGVYFGRLRFRSGRVMTLRFVRRM